MFSARLLTAAFVFSLVFPAALHAREMESFPVVKLQSLDKITARTMTFEANVGNTVKFGSLYIKIQACRKAPPVEQPESAAFLQIWEIRKDSETAGPHPEGKKPEGDAQWVFSGWMFASSPALSHMDHPVYDVWVLDCLTEKGQKKEEQKKQQEEAEPGEGEIEPGAAPAEPSIESEELSPMGD